MGETSELIKWVHTTEPMKHPVGSVIGWRDERSETGMACGVVIERDFQALRVKVRDIRAAIIKRSGGTDG